MSNHLTQRDVLYNAILRTVKETGSDMERGLVLAVLNEVSTAISMQSGREKLKSVLEKKERPANNSAGRGWRSNSVGLDKCIFDRFYREISFPHDEFQMAKITFSVELSADPRIRWEETWQGLLRFFAMTAYDTSLDLEKFLKDKILHSSSPDSDFKGTDRENPTG